MAAAWLIVLLLAAGLVRADEPQYSEYQVKGAFLAKFAMFVEWPEKTFPSKQTPVVIGILGEDPFGPQFEAALKREGANGRPFVLKHFNTPKELTDCQILFVGASESQRWQEILEAARHKAILTVGDQERFARRGGMVNFIKEGDRLRFEVNAAAVEAGGLKMSAKLLQVARLVTAEPTKGAP